MAKKKTAAKKPAKGKAKPKTRARVAPKAPPPAKRVTLPALLKLAREVLGISELRPGQAEALRHILAGRDVLAVMPTGSGKSLLYQLPSLVLPGLTVVVSPLIALITDQVEKMREKGVAIARIDSTLTVRQKRAMMALLDAPGGKLLLTTPERMADPEFRKLLTQAAGKVGVSRFVVDEAHCVSQWGHDFRPSYLVLRQGIEELGHPPVLATTATAPPHVRDDILDQLGMPKAKIVTTSFDRPNLSFEVIACPGEDDKKKILVALLKKLKRPGIVYCATVKAVEKLGEDLARHGIPVSTYHGRMTKKERDLNQARFMDRRSKLVMVATNAFGLGVDKADIRYVLHYHVPGSLEQYAQEAGRAGRDGHPARCVLLFSPDDVAIQEHFLKGTYPTRRQVLAVYEALEAWNDGGRRPTLAELATSSHVGMQRTRTVLALLKDEGWVVEERGGRFHLPDPPPDRDDVRERAKEYEKRRIADRRRLDALLDYVRASSCRNTIILDYLGEKVAKTTRCGRCDNCLRSAAEARAAAAEAEALEAELERRWDEEGDLEPVEEPEAPKVRMISLDAPKQAQVAREQIEVVEAPEPVEPVEIEAIDRTAAELAEEAPDGGAAEITVRKRKRREPEPRQVDGARAKKRRRKRKKKRGGSPVVHVASPQKGAHGASKPVVAPPRVVFTSPVAVMTPTPAPAAAPPSHAPPRDHHHLPAPAAAEATVVSPANPPPAAAPPGPSSRTQKPGPIVEYVRRPMKIAVTPIASATPHDSPTSRKKHKRRHFEPRRHVPNLPGPASAAPGPPMAAGSNAQPPMPHPPGEGKKKRRRRRKKKKGMLLQAGMPPSPTVTFWMPADAPMPPPSSFTGGTGGGAPAPPRRPPGAPLSPVTTANAARPTGQAPGQATGQATGQASGQPNGPAAPADGMGAGSGKRRRRRRRRRRGNAHGMVGLPGTTPPADSHATPPATGASPGSPSTPPAPAGTAPSGEPHGGGAS